VPINRQTLSLSHTTFPTLQQSKCHKFVLTLTFLATTNLALSYLLLFLGFSYITQHRPMTDVHGRKTIPYKRKLHVPGRWVELLGEDGMAMDK
jgi:hypothetical protein